MAIFGYKWDIERGLGIIPWVLKTSKSWNNVNESRMGPMSGSFDIEHE